MFKVCIAFNLGGTLVLSRVRRMQKFVTNINRYSVSIIGEGKIPAFILRNHFSDHLFHQAEYEEVTTHDVMTLISLVVTSARSSQDKNRNFPHVLRRT